MIPQHMLDAFQRYVEFRISPGSFLTAVLCNDLKGAVGSADSTNINLIPEYVSFLYNNAPSTCWGSVEKVQNWLNGV